MKKTEMKNVIKFINMLMICLLLAGGVPVNAQSPTGDSSKSTTAPGAPASNDPSITPIANAAKNKPADVMTTGDSSGKWGLLGLLGLLGLFGLRGNGRKS
jgi:MYXO-CTERM domain-containing protein